MSEDKLIENGILISIELNEEENYKFQSKIIKESELSKERLLEINETIESINSLKPECDKLDYALAASSGILCGIIDIFLVNAPEDSMLLKITDKWINERVKLFAKLFGWKSDSGNDYISAIRFLEKKFKIPYDQTGIGESSKQIYNLTPRNHHFKSIGHNSSILGLFFAILDQFNNTSHFISNGELITLVNADNNYELQGNNFLSKILCGFINWLGHLISDYSGSSSSKGRGMGIPSPIWTWSNDIIAIKSSLNIKSNNFNKVFNEIAIDIFEKGYDNRFQQTQMIPVFINEFLVRFMYSIRRYIKQISLLEEENTDRVHWEDIQPFSNYSVDRMLTVAHGSFCAVDIGEALIASANSKMGIDFEKFFLKVNVAGVGRFTISIQGEVRRENLYVENINRLKYLSNEKTILENYIFALEALSNFYDDNTRSKLVSDLINSDLYKEAFDKSVNLAYYRSVPETLILKDKDDIDKFFNGNN